MGGLAAAIRLRIAGFEVRVFEKNEKAGGRVNRLREEGFTFDTGPTLLLMTDVYRDLFAAAGETSTKSSTSYTSIQTTGSTSETATL
jgi:phytoene dehydrogenase-like protein